MFKKFIAILLLFLLQCVDAVNQKDVRIEVTKIEKENDQYNCKLKIQTVNGWKIYGNVKFSGTPENSGIIFNDGYKIGNDVYKTTIQIPNSTQGIINLKAEFPACSDKMCMFVEKKFTIDLSTQNDSPNLSLLYILLIAFLGGLILNCMPCVLPVLSLKLHSLMSNSSNKKHMLYTWYGIMLSFSLFSIIMALLKWFGHTVGWGMHFQNVHFLNISALFVFAFILSVYDRIKIFVSISNSDILNTRNEKIKNIASGMLATILAIPCTAPFLGTAAAIALESSFWKMITIFMTIGLGFSIPYLLASFLDIKINIKAGRWMDILKQVLGLGVIATFLWIIWLLSNHLSVIQLAFIFVGYIIIFTCINKCYLLSIVACIGICAVPFIMPKCNLNEYKVSESKKMWVQFDPIKLQEYISQGKVVFINVTADWCMTCKYNKSILLETDNFLKLVKKHNVICMEGDLTHNNDMVALFLKMHKQGGIPFNIVFGQNAKSGIKLGVIPTLNEVENAINKAKK